MFHLLVKTIKKGKKRVGRGWGSGKGKFSGRGIKGQTKRGSVRANFIGGAEVLSKRLPMLRGKGKNKSIQKSIGINIERIEQSKAIKNKSEITVKSLIKAKLVSAKIARSHQVRILGRGKLTKSISTSLPTTRKAVEKIKNAGGKLT
ncbi:MAG: 50S ribosomal protein L15 [Candidatus Roizmanbacteria bacterium]|nr:50S ribosomal protein L15 [Candidatus Roizmanbacteria bacterium]